MTVQKLRGLLDLQHDYEFNKHDDDNDDKILSDTKPNLDNDVSQPKTNTHKTELQL